MIYKIEGCYCRFSRGFFFFKQKSAYEMRISDWSSDVCSSDLDLARVMKYAEKTTAKIDCTFPVAAGEGALRDALKRIRAEAENAVRGGAGHIVLTDEAIGPDQAAMPMILATGAVHSHLEIGRAHA